YQVGHVFRAGELGRRHNPEFTMVEWYRAGDTHIDQMQVVEDLVVEFFRPQKRCQTPFLRTTYRDAFVRHIGADALSLAVDQLANRARRRRAPTPESLATDDRDGWLTLLLADLVEPHLGIDRPEFVYDYPASQAALAIVRPEDPPVAERFELYIAGIEVCNGYHELTDPAELRRPITLESQPPAPPSLPPRPAS